MFSVSGLREFERVQGMVLPRAVVPTFIAGLVDPAVAAFCETELLNVLDKYPDFFRSSLLEGVRNMFVLVSRRADFRAFAIDKYADVERAADRLYRMFRSKSAMRAEFIARLIDQVHTHTVR